MKPLVLSAILWSTSGEEGSGLRLSASSLASQGCVNFQCLDFYSLIKKKRPILFYFVLCLMLVLLVLSFIVNMEIEDRKCLNVYEGSPKRGSCLGGLRELPSGGHTPVF